MTDELISEQSKMAIAFSVVKNRPANEQTTISAFCHVLWHIKKQLEFMALMHGTNPYKAYFIAGELSEQINGYIKDLLPRSEHGQGIQDGDQESAQEDISGGYSEKTSRR